MEIVNQLDEDSSLRARAQRVVPGGMYGHGNAAMLPEGYPQFFARGEGCRIWDVDGNEYVDFMCGYGPNLLGMGHPKVEEAAARQRALGDSFNGPTARMVELAELMVDRVAGADWALFGKNGTDATTGCLTIARSATGKSRVLVAEHAYHGAAPWCTPSSAGVVEGDRAHLLYYTYNDIESVERAVSQAGDDLAGILVSPFKHDAFEHQELVDPAFAAALRRICDEKDAVLMLDDVRAGLRMHHGGSWDPLGVIPDLSAMSKAIANGYPIAAILGKESLREATKRIYMTGSFWYGSVAMAASLATFEVHRAEGVLERIVAMGERLRSGLDAQATAHGYALRQTGPVQMPMVLFEEDPAFEKVRAFTARAIGQGVYLHPFHNMFLCGAHTEADIDRTLEITEDAFAALD
jgi:glutamate-1-semialdehyde 2,1-aminomutase